MLETEADRLEMLKAVGEPLTLDGNPIWGVIEKEFLEDLDGPGIASFSPMLTCRTSDVKGVLLGAVVERHSGEKYSVRESEPDGTGISTLRLRDYG